MRTAREELWQEALATRLRRLCRKAADLALEGKPAEWKLALAAHVTANATVTNRWLATTLHMRNRSEVSRKVSAWQRKPCAERPIRINPKPQGLTIFAFSAATTRA